jgi:hypothetical protein
MNILVEREHGFVWQRTRFDLDEEIIYRDAIRGCAEVFDCATRRITINGTDELDPEYTAYSSTFGFHVDVRMPSLDVRDLIEVGYQNRTNNLRNGAAIVGLIA